MPLVAVAMKITLFMDTDTYIKRAHDIVLAECISIPEGGPEMHHDGLHLVEVAIVKVLKGSKQTGRGRIAMIYRMEVGRVYLLSSLGGSAYGTDFLALPELAVVPLPTNLNVGELEGKGLKEQVQYIFSRHLSEVETELEPLLKEKALLEKSLSDSRHEKYVSDEPLKIGRIVETSSKTDPHRPDSVILDLDGNKLEWSLSEAGKTGFLYFEKVGSVRTPYWEFAPCDATKVEDLEGKPLKTKFYSMYSPGRAEVGWAGGLQAIHVFSGKVLLARTSDDLRKVFIIQIVQDQEHMTVRYTTIQGR